MNIKNEGEFRHNQLVGQLEKYLFDLYDYEKMWKFFKYCCNGQEGEVDLLAMADKLFDFYEVKCIYNSKSKRKVYQQFEKYQRAYPEQHIRGFMFTGDRGLLRL